MKVLVQEIEEPAGWFFRKTIGHNVILNEDCTYTCGAVEYGSRPQFRLRRDGVIIEKQLIKSDCNNWRMLRNGVEFAVVTHCYGLLYGSFFDVITDDTTYKSFNGASSLSKDKCFWTPGFFCWQQSRGKQRGRGAYSKSSFIDELDDDVAAMLAFYCHYLDC